MYKIGVSKEVMKNLTKSDSFIWPISMDDFLSNFAIRWTGNSLKEVQELVGRDQATMLVSPRLVIHTINGPRYPEIWDWIVRLKMIFTSINCLERRIQTRNKQLLLWGG